MVAESVPIPEACFHCGLEIPPGVSLTAEVLGEPRAMCCLGCLAVAEMLEARGLAAWYRRREAPTGVRPDVVPEMLEKASYLGLPELDAEFATRAVDGLVEATVLIEGLTCAACVWVIERHLEALDGIRSVRVNLVSHRATVVWDPALCGLRAVVTHLAEIGFSARPDRPDVAATMERDERRTALIRLGVSGLGTMNVMTYAVALYLGAVDGMEPGVQQFLRWMCLLVTTPVVFIGARPFFEGAFRDVRLGRPGMDVPVALAIAGAYLVSGWAVVQGTGEVYFESACMFTFFLGAGRYLEMNVRHRSASLCRELLESSPRVALLADDAGERVVPAASLVIGDRFVVRPGEMLPADGTIVEGRSSVEEALLTGEPWPRSVEPGSNVIAGSLNTESPLLVEATRVGPDTALAAVVALVERAQSEKPPIARTADRVAAVFVSVVLALAILTVIAWSFVSPDRAIWATLAVLVATCPCALSLATPTALAASTQALASTGLLVTRGHVLEGLAKANRFVFDKTGTLTRGEAALVRVISLRGDSEQRLVSIARRLEAHSEHPLARVFSPGPGDFGPLDDPAAVGLVSESGAGVEGTLESVRYRIGRPDWAMSLVSNHEQSSELDRPEGSDDRAHSWILLADPAGPVAWFGIDDSLRAETSDMTRRLSELGLSLEMLSGDPSPAAGRVAEELGLESSCSVASPSDKVERMRVLHAEHQVVVAVGDGVNDGPFVRAADVSIAMGSGCDLTRVSADAVLVTDDLSRLPLAIEWARLTRRVIRQNFAWAIGYNLCVLPLAMSGRLVPWLAAAGMSLSSLVVVLNASRLRRIPERP
jgi:Cu2+-exporting ATPase